MSQGDLISDECLCESRASCESADNYVTYLGQNKKKQVASVFGSVASESNDFATVNFCCELSAAFTLSLVFFPHFLLCDAFA